MIVHQYSHQDKYILLPILFKLTLPIYYNDVLLIYETVINESKYTKCVGANNVIESLFFKNSIETL